MKSNLPRVPPQPITDLLERLAEIIAERPPQPLTAELSGRLGEIIAERTASVAPEQRIHVAQLTIIESLLTTPYADVVNRGAGARDEVPLTGLLRRHVALELARLWIPDLARLGIPEKAFKEILRQRELKHIEDALKLAKWSRETRAWEKADKPRPQSGALAAVRDSLRFEQKHGRWTGRGFHSVAALAQYLKRWRAKKKIQP
jgi:hypothetical protein